MKRRLGWCLVCPGRWQGRTSLVLGLHRGKRAFWPPALVPRGCMGARLCPCICPETEPVNAAAWEESLAAASPSAQPFPEHITHPLSTELICVMTCLQRISGHCPGTHQLRAAGSCQSRPPARCQPVPEVQAPTAFSPEDAGAFISGQTRGFGHQSPGAERELSCREGR